MTIPDDDADDDADMDGEGTRSDDDEDEEEEQVTTPAKRRKQGEKKTPYEHCDISFMKDTVYYLLAADNKKQWGTATSEDPAPPVPESKKGAYESGDYLLIRGHDIKLKSTGSTYTHTTFDPSDELILTNTWELFDVEMTGQDLYDLNDDTFLLWWQNIKPPVVPKAKRQTTIPKKPKGKGKR